MTEAHTYLTTFQSSSFIEIAKPFQYMTYECLTAQHSYVGNHPFYRYAQPSEGGRVVYCSTLSREQLWLVWVIKW